MNTSELKTITLQAIQFVIIIMLISFVLDTGIDKLAKEPFLTTLENWFNSILTLNKLGIWVAISLGYSYFRVTRLKK